MFLPRFTIRVALFAVTCCALVFVVVGMAFRGETWAWGISIGLISLGVTLVVHAAWFGLVWVFARLPAAEHPMQPAATAPGPQQNEVVGDNLTSRVEAQS